MTGLSEHSARLEALLAGLLQNGSRLASATIAVGCGAALIKSHIHAAEPLFHDAERLIGFGIVLFMLLPAVRVLLMMVMFTRDGNYRLATIAAVVLTIILIGCLVGTRTMSAMPG